MSTSHLDRKEIKRPDAFLEKVNSIFHFINENTATFLAVLAGLFAIGLGYALYSNMHERNSEAANSALFTAKKSLTTTLEKAPKAAADWEKTAKAELEQVEKVAAAHQGTRASFEALLLLGDTYFDRNSPEKAAEFYKRAADSIRSKGVKALALHSLAYAYENAKKYDQAIEALRQVLSLGDKTVRGDALMALARNFELKGDKVNAMAQYDLVAKEFPATPLAKSAEIQKNQLQ